LHRRRVSDSRGNTVKLRLFALTAILAASPAFVQAKPAKTHGGKLGLSADQKLEFRTVRQQAQKDAQPIQDELRQNRQALTAAVKANDTAQIEALSKTQGELRGQARTIHSEARAKIYAELTPDQRAKMDQIRSQHRKRGVKKAA
jgi:Spy/CpxP family protein refolding chaperone